jgi:hypothetical protein
VACPLVPAADYPVAYPIMDLLRNWGTDDTEIPSVHFNSLCYFDFQKDFQQALNYRLAEKPFVVFNIPEVGELVNRWADLDYLSAKIGRGKFKSEISDNNHFMYWSYVALAGSKYQDRYGRYWKVLFRSWVGLYASF